MKKNNDKSDIVLPSKVRLPFDYANYCIVCKLIDKKDFKITNRMIKRFCKKSKKLNKEALLILESKEIKMYCLFEIKGEK